MSLPPRSHLHLLTRMCPQALRVMRLQQAGGVEVRCLLLHDAVLHDGAGLPAAAVWRAAVDLRRRGLGAEGAQALEDAAIVAAIADADAATAW